MSETGADGETRGETEKETCRMGVDRKRQPEDKVSPSEVERGSRRYCGDACKPLLYVSILCFLFCLSVHHSRLLFVSGLLYQRQTRDSADPARRQRDTVPKRVVEKGTDIRWPAESKGKHKERRRHAGKHIRK